MRRLCLITLLLIPYSLMAQSKTELGINVASFLAGTLDIRASRQMTPALSLQLGTGLRLQGRDPEGRLRALDGLSDYVQQRNTGAYFSVGGRLINPQEDEYEYPYIGFHLIGVYYKDDLLPEYTPPAGQNPETVSGLKLGFSTTIGFSFRLTPRMYLDLAAQMGYSPPREDLLAYYLPGMGYSTFGFGYIGVRGGHIQPVITLKYTLIQDQRRKLYDVE